MNVPKKGIGFVLAGTVLMLSALSLFLYNQYEDARAGQEAENLQAIILQSIPETQPAEKDKALTPQMPVKEIDGYGYVGYLSIPDMELELPVMSEWDYTRLKIAPCRQFGSSRADDLVIAAHNFESHFGRLKEMSLGNTVTFTDMAGIVNTYRAEMIETLSPKDVEAVQNSGYDLVLYTCTRDGQERVAVFCNRTGESAVP